DSVKITVIATGFKEADMRRNRHRENFEPVIVPRHRDHARVDYADDFVEEPVAAASAERDAVAEPEPAFEPDPAPAFEQTPAVFNQPQAEVMSMDGMRMSSPSYVAEDLDVPAFLRKRNDVM
ncbi:MAG TPA: hypothetical protein VMU28_12545, partial [Terriglobales bacterium]|nr:hypothetical protein [Terriglobales bacterium]